MRSSQTFDGLTIARVADLLDVPVPTIRSWERRYGLLGPRRTVGGHRRYATEEIDQLRRLRDQIAMGRAAREAAAKVVRASSTPTDRPSMDAMIDAAMTFDPWEVRKRLEATAAVIGVERTITEVALPAMHEVGDRWAAGRCGIGNEHAATEGVRTWLARARSDAPDPTRRGALVLACGPDELHSLGLDAFGTILVRRGWSCRSLGPNTTSDAIVDASRTAAGLVVTCQRSSNRRKTVAALRDARAAEIPMFYAGAAFTRPSARRDIPGTFLGEDLPAAADMIERMVTP